MICWRHLSAGTPEQRAAGYACTKCVVDDLRFTSLADRADFFKSLVAAYIQNDVSSDPPSSARDMMSEIERRVEAGTLFGKGESDG